MYEPRMNKRGSRPRHDVCLVRHAKSGDTSGDIYKRQVEEGGRARARLFTAGESTKRMRGRRRGLEGIIRIPGHVQVSPPPSVNDSLITDAFCRQGALMVTKEEEGR